MDGRLQLPVIRYLMNRFGRSYVDCITEAGPVGLLAHKQNSVKVREMLRKVRVSVNAHGSRSLAIVAHYDCAGHPFARARQVADLTLALAFLEHTFADLEIIGLWVDHESNIEEIRT